MTNIQAAEAILADKRATPMERRAAWMMIAGIATRAEQDQAIIADWRNYR